MQKGKINKVELEKIIEILKLDNRKDILQSAEVGVDCALIDFGEEACVLSCDPITAAKENIGKLAVHINCNDIATTGAEPIGLLVTILVPESVDIKLIQLIMKEMKEEAEKLNVQIIGGHTEVTSSVNSVVLCVTAVGKILKKEILNKYNIFEGFDIIVTKKLCIEGSYILVNDFRDECEKILSKIEIDNVNDYINYISVVKDGIISKKNGAYYMHDITEGGILGALCEMSMVLNLGFEVWCNLMPISNETRKLCYHFNLDPLRLISSGSMLIVAKNGNDIKNALLEKNIDSTIIGKIKNKGQSIWIDGVKNDVEYNEKDEIYKLF